MGKSGRGKYATEVKHWLHTAFHWDYLRAKFFVRDNREILDNYRSEGITSYRAALNIDTEYKK